MTDWENQRTVLSFIGWLLKLCSNSSKYCCLAEFQIRYGLHREHNSMLLEKLVLDKFTSLFKLS